MLCLLYYLILWDIFLHTSPKLHYHSPSIQTLHLMEQFPLWKDSFLIYTVCLTSMYHCYVQSVLAITFHWNCNLFSDRKAPLDFLHVSIDIRWLTCHLQVICDLHGEVAIIFCIFFTLCTFISALWQNQGCTTTFNSPFNSWIFSSMNWLRPSSPFCFAPIDSHTTKITLLSKFDWAKKALISWYGAFTDPCQKLTWSITSVRETQLWFHNLLSCLLFC